MGVVPRKIEERVVFWKNHVAPFTTNAVAIGITAPQAASFETLSEAADVALAAQSVAFQAFKDATSALHDADEAVTNAGMAIIEQVRAKSRSSGDSVYTLASLPKPATPASKGNPGVPYDWRLELLMSGTLRIKFRCNNPVGTAGTMYQVYRAIGPAGEYEYLGGTGKKSFDDDTIPAGATQITYKIQAVRSTAIGDPGVILVNFGTNEAGESFATLLAPPATKLAA